MKHKNQNKMAIEEFEQDPTNSQEGNGLNKTTNIQLTNEDKEKGNLKNFNISKKTIKKLKARNVEFLYPVQTESYTGIYEQKDCLIQSSNGTGKTLAFVIPIVELLQHDKSVELVSGRAPRALILGPTRDITKQISDDFQSIINDLSIVTIYSAKKKSDDQEKAISNGCDILVATPDRLKEFIDNEKIDLSQIKHVILDEIDRMLDSPAIDHIKTIFKHIFTSDQETKAQLIVFSGTMPDSVRKLTKKFLTTDYVTINLAKRNTQETSADDDDDDDDDNSEEPINTSSNNKSKMTDQTPRSLLSKQENYTTYQLTANDEIKSVGFVFTMLRKCFGDDFDAKGTIAQVAFTKDFKSAIFDLPSELDEQLQGYWKDSARIQMGPITELPEIDESSKEDYTNYSGGKNKSPYGGGGNRNSGKSNACFNCQKEGHKSWECPESNGTHSQRNSGNKFGGGGGGGGGGCFNCGKDGHKSFECTEPKKAGGRSGGGGGGGERSNACFNCGKDGHRSFECSEPKKAGGRSGGGGERSNACFNCGKDGHRSFECPEPKKSGGRSGGGGERSNACFNCGKEGHRSFECPEAKKGRPSFGGGGRGGSRGGGGGGGAKRSFGTNNENGHSVGETTNKKIKFNDDDDE
ncbi:unnamed protein product [Rotaria sordida]|uniref:RNA helicase n=1 Tax=Rotaria sordida TaxID=392033 RepID=A0A814DDZ5_9BILA|nr:unnamed protein product [Rotaria sordida]CAF0954501.1 unnamed protein product [Rotaria sordida]